MNTVLQLPRDQRTDAIVRFLKESDHPDMDEAVTRRIIDRAGDSFWDAFEKRNHDQEFLQSWALSAIATTRARDMVCAAHSGRVRKVGENPRRSNPP